MRKDALVADVISSPTAWHSVNTTSVTGQYDLLPSVTLPLCIHTSCMPQSTKTSLSGPPSRTNGG